MHNLALFGIFMGALALVMATILAGEFGVKSKLRWVRLSSTAWLITLGAAFVVSAGWVLVAGGH